jgi:surfeit locus 1 family protein
VPRLLSVLTSPRMLGLHLLAVVLTTAALLLGIWQYDAWGMRRDNQSLGLAHAKPQWLASVMSSDDPFPGDAIGQPVQFGGVWLPADTVYVSGRHLHGRKGYWAVTPVSVCNATGGAAASTSTRACAKSSAVLVVRGWTPTLAEAPPAPKGTVEVSGWLQPAEGTGRQDRDPGDDVLPQLRIADAISHVRQDLYGAYVINRSADNGLERVTPGSLPQPETFTAIRNLLYALEWWVFAGFAVFLWWRWCSDEVRRVIGDGDHVGPESEPAAPGVASKT